MAARARDLMQTHVITVDPELPLLDAHRLFVEEEIHGAPVVDEAGRVLGVVSSADLVRAVYDGGSGRAPDYRSDSLDEGRGFGLPLSDGLKAKLDEMRVADVMTAGGVTVAPDAPIEEVAGRMRQHGIHRVPVVDRGSLAGIITTFDLIALLEKPEAR